MYVNASLGSHHLALFNDTGQQADKGMNWGATARDVFAEPISAANESKDMPPDNLTARGVQPADAVGGGGKSLADAGYFDWVNSMSGYTRAANQGLIDTAETLMGEGDELINAVLASDTPEVADNTTETKTPAESAVADQVDTGNAEQVTSTDSYTPASRGSTGWGGGGLLGFLFGR